MGVWQTRVQIPALSLRSTVKWEDNIALVGMRELQEVKVRKSQAHRGHAKSATFPRPFPACSVTSGVSAGQDCPSRRQCPHGLGIFIYLLKMRIKYWSSTLPSKKSEKKKISPLTKGYGLCKVIRGLVIKITFLV